jgi:A/G-specific adenine glycosylase
MRDFAQKLIAWQKNSGRHDLPWQRTRDPYRVWLSEIMLQQTQVAVVVPYYQRFLERFPDVQALAAADEDAVLRLWSGLGYYARARNLHAAAKELVRCGAFPRDAGALQALPGIGRSTAGAIAVFAFGRRAAILDGNVKRVLARCFGSDADLWERSESLVPARGVQGYTQALMDLGATVCTRLNPSCNRCPLAAQCVARREGRIAELPAKKSRKAVPLRTSTWLVLVSAKEVLLERRPSPGLWGGLWTFPELERGSAGLWCKQHFGCVVDTPIKLELIEHGFTHFRLQAQPMLCRVQSRLPRAEEAGRVWMGIDDAAGAAVPVPVRTVLKALRLPRPPRALRSR